MEEKIKVIYYEDNGNLREGISFLIQSTPQLDLLATFSNADTVKVDTEELKPDVILMDIDMPGTNGIKGLQIIKERYPQTYIIMHTVFEDEDLLFQCLCSGANGYILKNTSFVNLLEAIDNVLHGGAPLSPSNSCGPHQI